LGREQAGLTGLLHQTPEMRKPMSDRNVDAARNIFIAGLRNAHAVENQAHQIMSRQVERLQNYPQVEQRLRQHIEETNGQIQRLDQLLDSLGESASTLKDAALGLVGNMAALAHTWAADEILKNSFANFAFENFEIASYKSLITVAEAAGQQNSISALQANLQEEVAMAKWLDDHLREVTMRYISLEQSGQKADR
jgi:ferritin-like metal-binding protein YciE